MIYSVDLFLLCCQEMVIFFVASKLVPTIFFTFKNINVSLTKKEKLIVYRLPLSPLNRKKLVSLKHWS